MGGIAGIVYSDVFHVEQHLEIMLDTMRHRGPEFREDIIYKNIHVGTCGTAIARQNNLIVGMDGLIQNSGLLEGMIRAKGYTLTSQNPAELVLYAYLIWENKFVEHIRGEFAIFIIDQKQEKLILARDRVGRKPLYWYQEQNHFIFASELKVMLSSQLIIQDPSTDAVASYLYLGYVPRDMTLIKGVNKLLPGHYLELHKERPASIHQYWSLSSYCHPVAIENKHEIISHLNILLHESVAASIPKNSTPGCLLSGGLGSASIAYYMRQVLPNAKISAYTVAFQGENIQNLRAAEEVAHSLKLNHSNEIITPQNLLDDLVKAIWYMDEPIADVQFISTWKLIELAKASRVLFSGMGSDELLAGHTRYVISTHELSPWHRLIQTLMPFIKRFLLPMMMQIYQGGALKLLKCSRTNPWQSGYLRQNALFGDEVRRQAAPSIADQFDLTVFLNQFQNLPKINSTISSYLYVDFKTRLVDNYILQYERFSTVQGINWRTPFLSSSIIEYLMGLPEPNQIAKHETFYILKELLKNELPSAVINRTKTARTNFLNSWVEVSNLAEIFKTLPNGTLVEMGLISKKWLMENTATPEKRRESFRYLWAILVLEIWFRLFINQRSQPYPPLISAWDLLSE